MTRQPYPTVSPGNVRELSSNHSVVYVKFDDKSADESFLGAFLDVRSQLNGQKHLIAKAMIDNFDLAERNFTKSFAIPNVIKFMHSLGLTGSSVDTLSTTKFLQS